MKTTARIKSKLLVRPMKKRRGCIPSFVFLDPLPYTVKTVYVWSRPRPRFKAPRDADGNIIPRNPKSKIIRSTRTKDEYGFGKIICPCNAALASEWDGLCTKCRGMSKQESIRIACENDPNAGNY